MKHMKRLLILLQLFSIITLSTHAQVETKYYSSSSHPSTISRAKNLVRNNIVHRMPTFNMAELLREDSINAGMNDRPYRFGKDFPLSVSLDDGIWYSLEDGRVWTITFESKDAISLNFIFDNFYLPIGATLEIMNEDGTTMYGPVKDVAIPRSGHFMTDIIAGEKATIFLYEPYAVQGQSTLSITSLIHGYRGLDFERDYGDEGASSNCNVDVACHQEYTNESKGVALIMLANGYEICSGSLLMSTDMSFKPYVLTAFHCIDLSEDGSLSSNEITDSENWMFKFNYKKEICNGTTLAVSTTYNGSILRAAWLNTDFALMEINSDLKSNHSLFWLGWDKSGTTPNSGAGIHHPKGDLMKISIEDDAFTTAKWNGTNSTNEFNHWAVNYDEGITQGGSSGSPLLNQNHKVVGQLHGGPNYEDNPCLNTNSKYGKFNISWVGGGTNTTRLSNWLDPIGTGQTTMEGLNPSTVCVSGPDTPCGTAVYSIPGLPDGYSVTWSWSELIEGFFLLNNTPTTNSCTILNDNKAYINGQLIATIKKNGVTVATRTKNINTGADLFGYCSQDGYSYPGWLYQGMSSYPFGSGDVINVFKGPTITLVSSNFAGANITYSGTTPLDWTHNNNTITFHFKYLRPINPNDPIQNRARSLPSTACLVITGKYPNNCKTFQFKVIGLEPFDVMSSIGDSRSESVRLSVQSTGSLYTFTILAPNDISTDIVSEVKDKTFSVEDYLPWRMTISNSLTGKIVYSSDIKDSSLQLETADWSTGIYVIEARIGSEVLRQKFIIAR